MTGRVILVEVAKVVEALLNERLSGSLAIEEVASTEQLFYELEQSRHTAETLVLGVRVDDPVSIAQRVHFLGKHLPVLILSNPDGCSQLKQALQFSPFVGSEVTAWSTENIDALPGAVLDAASKYKKRREYRGTIQAAQRRLSDLTREPPQLTHYLDRLIDRAPIGLLNVEATGKILSLNRRACHILGLTEREAIGLDVASLFPSGEVGRFKAMMARLVAPSKKRPPEVFEISSATRERTFVEVTAESLIDRSGQLGSTIIFQDVTDRVQAERERKQAEEEVRNSEGQLRLVTDAVPVLISYIDAQYRYRFNNKAFEDWFGYSRKEMTGRHVKEVIGEDAYEAVRPHLESAFQGQAVECEVVIPDGSKEKRYVRGNLVPDLSDKGEVRGIVTVVSDITERKRAEEREKQHMLELAHVSRVTTLGEMSSQLAHELAQPLMAIANFSDASLRMLKASTESREEVIESLTDILAQADRAREIIVQLRNLMRKNELQSAPEDINELVREVVRLSRAEARWHDLDLRLELAEALPPVSVDKTLVEQVILNLIHNAVEALQTVRRHKRRLEIRTMRDTDGQILVEVSDNGPGLTHDTKGIFEPFFTTKPEGMGMGLAICRSIIGAHQGRLWASANEFGGATFRFTLAAHMESVNNGHSTSQGLHS